MVANPSTSGTFSENTKERGQFLLKQGWRMTPKLQLVFTSKSPVGQHRMGFPINLAGLSGNRAFQPDQAICRTLSFCLLSFPLDKIRCLGKMTCWFCLQDSEHRRLFTNSEAVALREHRVPPKRLPLP